MHRSEVKLCECGCGQPTNRIAKSKPSKGLKVGDQQRFIYGHQCLKSSVEYLETDLGYETPCWIWQRATSKCGEYRYGSTTDARNKTAFAHRIVYERHVGSIPDAMVLDHLCRNTLCVNPAHLQPVSHAENLRRGKGTKLTVEKVREIRSLSIELSRDELGELFGIHPSHVSRIVNRVVWADVQ